MTSISTWLTQLDLVRFNPSAIQRLALSTLEDVSAGRIDIVDPTTPFNFLLEAAAVNSAAAMVQNEVLTRKLYPSLALSEDELYLHMSDVDYLGRFATPSRTSFTIVLDKEEFISKAIDTGVGGIRKMTIPRHTEFSVVGNSFTMQYPIDIKVMGHGGLQIVYDVDKLSPLQTLSTNVVDWNIVRLENRDFIKIEVPVSQFAITPKYGQLSLAVGYVKVFDYTDNFYFARAYFAQADGSWKEMLTTHSDQVFDPLRPTALLKVNAGKLTVSIPQVYTTTQLVNTEIRVDIYTTKGPLDLILNNYDINNFNVRWVDLEGDDGGRFVAPLTTFNTISVFSDKVVSGGSAALTFEALRERVLTNATGSPSLPITNVQLTTRLNDLGYDVVKNVDNITNRQFKATKALPRPTDGSVVSGAGSSMQTLIASMVDLANSSTAIVNGDRLTLLPTTLYENIEGLIRIVPPALSASILSLPLDVRVRKINEARYLYTPFHYVLDNTNNRFEHRAYYLDNPAVESKSFIEENDTTGMQVSTKNFLIERTIDGYRLTIIVQSGPTWKVLSDSNVFCQLSFKPIGEKDRAFLNGSQIGLTSGGERIFAFDINTNYDIDNLNRLTLTSFAMYEATPRLLHTPLVTEFDIVFATDGTVSADYVASEIDNALGRILLPSGTVGLTQERLKIKMGVALEGLWHASRSIVSSLDYERYAADVPALWESTVFQRDPITGAIIITVDVNGNLQYETLHLKGDPVLDGQGNPTNRYLKGDPILDADGRPIVKSSRTMVRQLDLMLIDGIYWFASEGSAVEYKRSIPDTVASWVTGDIAQVDTYLLEQTKLFFFPKNNLGQVAAIVDGGESITLAAEQSFSITYFLDRVTFSDPELRVSLTKMAIQIINEELQKPRVTLNSITSKITASAGNDIIAVRVEGLGGALGLTAIALTDDSVRLSIRKIATAQPDGSIGVKDDVDVTFVQHTV